jgi:hypothetical protein
MFGLIACATGMPVVDAQDDFRRARLRHRVAWMTGADDRFRPRTDRVRRRWERVALAYRTGVGLPPITAVERADGLYVIDGRHRVSVAAACGHRSIDAWVRRAA